MRKENLIFGAVICTIGYILGPFSGACSKMLGPGISVFTILFFQNAICLIFTLPEIAKDGLSSLKTKRYGLHFARDLGGVASYFLFFYSLKSIPLVDGVLLLYSAPLWIPFIALAYPKVKMKGHTWWGILVGLLGIILVLKPGKEVLNPAALMALGSGILAGFTSIVIRRLSFTDTTNQILFYYFLFGTIVTAPFFFSNPAVTPTELLYLLGVGLFMYLAQSLGTQALRHGKADVLAPLYYIGIVASGILGWYLWGDVPDAVAFIGMLLVILGGVLSIYFEKRYEKKIETKKL